MRHQIIAILIIIVAMAGDTFAQGEEVTDPGKEAKQQDIRKLIIASGSAMATMDIVDGILASYQRAYPNMPESFWKDAEDNVNAFDYLERLVPIYDKHLSHEEIKKLLEFYESPIGKKLVKVQPRISNESIQAGQQWGQQATSQLASQFEGQEKK